MSDPIWIICPVLNNLQMSLDAIGDFLDQTVPTRVLVINQGSDDDTRLALEREAELKPDRLFVWSHQPPLPSLSTTWNRALDMVWETGGDRALVVNNDTKLARCTVQVLSTVLDREQALFVSAVGVMVEQFDPNWHCTDSAEAYDQLGGNRGGPDFSCFLISRECHQRFRFDENHIPLFAEDLTYHRELMLAGEGKRIFSINLPYAHLASQTLKRMDPEKRARLEHQINTGSRAYYSTVWGGEVNAETFMRKGDPTSAVTDGSATTPELQRYWQSR